MHSSLFLNPNCSGLTNLCSKAYLAILLVTIFEIIFKPTFIREISQKLLQSETSPFFGIDIIEAEFYPSGKSPAQILLNNESKH